ncbi:TetR/AcrR family transcriptional regulator [Frondihabitans australicus]|uniref:TetR family transcriptional regulator n=1 Tax=Frondihabitans australicus TaxID=386892 RepID=A0A495IJ90_9MICO|nr:TetR family transcriptional regulator C-terminal domain-containing protein [Frondihabitans australicus]RKR76054.1 TetR family transcriptional regulator [Frondihabitans australicus]
MTFSPAAGASDPRRDAIDAAARRIAVRHGLSGITLRRLTADVGVAPGVIAELEPSMGALIARTFDELATSELHDTQRDIDAAASPLEALRLMIEALLQDSHNNFNSIWADAWSLGRHNIPLARVAREASIEWQEMFRILFQNGIDQGQFVARDADLVAQEFLALIDAATAYRLVGFGTKETHLDLLRRTMEHSLGLPASTL